MLKYKIYVFLLFILCISGIYYVSAKTYSKYNFIGKVIYIDPGHGGLDAGAINKDKYEKDINLKISLKLEKRLGDLGAIVLMTRNSDYDLAKPNASGRKRSDLLQRSNLINNSDCDMFLSIHLNSDISKSWNGAQVFYNSKLDINKTIAQIFQKNFNKDLKSNRKYRKDNSLLLQKSVNKPGVLLEVGFLSNPTEAYKLTTDDYQNKIVDSIINSLNEYFNKT